MLTLQEISDRAELTQLVTDYAYAIDERAWERLDRVFTPDAYIDYRAMGGIDGKYPAVRAWLPDALKHFPGYMHFIGNLSFEISGDRARGKVACFNPMVVPDPNGGSDTMFLGLWYYDEYTRTPQGWRISRREEKKSYDYNMPDWMKKALKLA
ncbi:MAG TPA: nuclear transport factor 2 family protein [Nevskiaceae bacterium]|nr:nuclear transport factor 2 family protein [Nevskiaceae bacterium]